MGPGTQEGVLLGPVQNRPQYERVKELIAATHAAGHRFLAGGEVSGGPGYFIPPAVVDNPPDDARVVVEEPFGPIVPLLRFSEVDEVVRRANDSEFGLGGSVWSNDLAQARARAWKWAPCGSTACTCWTRNRRSRAASSRASASRTASKACSNSRLRRPWSAEAGPSNFRNHEVQQCECAPKPSSSAPTA